MPAHKWLVIARNEYWILTSSIRTIRRYFPYLILGLLAVYVLFVAPAIVNVFIDDFLVFIISVAAVPTVQIVLFMFFFLLILFPISDTLREVKTEHLEIFYAAPVNPSDVLLGEFLVLPLLAGLFVLLDLISLGLDLLVSLIGFGVGRTKRRPEAAAEPDRAPKRRATAWKTATRWIGS